MAEVKADGARSGLTGEGAKRLSLADQVALTVGDGWWRTAGVPDLGLEAVDVSDGPNGARGARWGEISACLPSATALGATWDPQLVRKIGEVLGDEALDKGARVLLAPTVNIHRHPVGGRSFECFSEDPVISASMAVAYVQGVQSRGVGCAIKHFVCNDQELERMSIDVQVDERPFREIYLVPFEAAVREAGVCMVMAAYNKLRGEFCSENRGLLLSVLKEEWGFEGVVVSDWFGTRSTAALEAGLDLEMPGPASFLGKHLVDAVAQGTVSADAVRDAADRMVRLLQRLGSHPPVMRRSAEERSTLARQAAAAGIVLLKNESSLLPLDPATMTRLAVAGPAAARLCPQGGGSAEVTLPYERSPLQAITARAGSTDVSYEPGCIIPGTVPPSDRRDCTRRTEARASLSPTSRRTSRTPSRSIATSSPFHAWSGSVLPTRVSPRGCSGLGPPRCSPRIGRAPGTSVWAPSAEPVCPSTTRCFWTPSTPHWARTISAWLQKRSPPRWSCWRASHTR